MAFFIYLTLLFIWRKLQPDAVLFFQGLVLAFIVAAMQLLIQSKKQKRSGVVKDTIITFLVCYCFMFTIPTTVDRSYSVRMILELKEHPEGMTRPQIEHTFSEYFAEHGGVQKRLTEQLATGSLSKIEDRYVLTTFGYFLANSFDWFQKVFSIRRVEDIET